MKSKSIHFIYGSFLILLLACTGQKKSSETLWQNLYNGKDLTGWIQRNGEAPFEAVDSMIVGTTKLNTPNSFLCTEKDFGDFILEFDFLVDSSMNSGVQFRSLSLPEYQNGRVHGYQVEIDPSPRGFTGGIYDEARAGWLYAVNDPGQDAARRAFKNGQWNRIRVEAVGNHIKTWVNDIPVANLYDETTSSGFIALQVHAINDSSMLGKQIVWKNIRILTENLAENVRETSAPSRSCLVNKLTDEEISQGWKLLFDGQTSAGWRSFGGQRFPDKGWKIENGMITIMANKDFVFGKEAERGGDIITLDEYFDFELHLQAKVSEGANSGLKYFVKETEKSVKGSGVGFEYQIIDISGLSQEAKKKQKASTLYFGSLYDLIPAQGVRVNPVGQWNNIRIVTRGTHVEHWVNGFKVVEFEKGSDEFRKLVSASKFKEFPGFADMESGHILLQDHGGEVSFRSIKIKVLS